MNITGDIGEGQMGNLTDEQAREWLQGKDSRSYNAVLQQKLKSCIGNIKADPGGAGGGGGNTRYTFRGDATYHVSNGAGANGGVTLFYVKRPGNTAKIIAMGYHVGAQTYQLTWVHHDWSAMRSVQKLSLDK